MLILGEEIILRIANITASDNDSENEIFLKYMGTDRIGLKMKGRFPALWKKGTNSLAGPDLFSHDHQFKAVDVNYPRNLIWLRELVPVFQTQPRHNENGAMILGDLAGFVVKL